MKKISKRVFALILVALMFLSVFPINGFAEEIATQSVSSNARVTGRNYCATVSAQWAIDHWDDYYSVLYNLGYWDDGGDCANFVSQCLYMGGLDMDDYWNISGYKAHWGPYYENDYAGSYIRCQQLYNYLVKIGAQVIRNPSASQVSIGDVILYRREGASRMTHTSIVIDIKNGQPVVAAHSTGRDMYISDQEGYDWHLNFSGNNTYLMKLNGTTCVNYNPRNFDVYVASGGDTRLYVSASTSNGYYNTFLTGSYPDYAFVYKKSSDGQWGYTFRYGKWGWIKLKNFTYLSHQESAPVSHDFGDWFVVQVADCKNDGIDKHVCKRCGYEETKTTKGGHVIEPKATCLSAGFCKICGEQCEQPLGHNWDAGTIVVQPTCTEEGVKKFVCKRDSSHVKTTAVPALGHNHLPGATAPTCTAHGENVHTCSRCSDSYIVANPNGGWSDWMERDTSIEALLTSDKIKTKTQYSYRDKQYTSSGSSSMSGWTHYDTQRTSWGSTQGPVYSDPSNGSRNVWSEQYVASTTTHYKYYHRYGWGKNVNTGEYEYVWGNDSQLPNGDRHTLDRTSELTYKRTSAGNKVYGSYTCPDCGAENMWMSDGTYTVDNMGTRWYYQEPVYTYYFWQWGSWSSWSDTKATATSEREVATRTLYQYDLTALGHNWKNEEKVQVCKCGTNESSQYCYAIGQVCTRCGVTNPDAVKYVEHNYGSWYETSNANGYITYRADCQNSGCECYKTKSNKNCDFVVTSAVKATCTTDGYEISTCSYHGETNKVITEPALGHNVPADAEGVVIKPATCDEDGILRKYCERYDDGKTCSHYVDTPIPAFGHTMTKYDAVSATCTEDGRTEYYECELCHGFFADKDGKKEYALDEWIIPAYDHVPSATVEWVVVEENGCGKTGWKHKLCNREVDGEVCNHVIEVEAIPEIPADYYVFDSKFAEEINGEWYPTRCDEEGIIYITCRNCENTDHAHGSKAGTATYDEEMVGRLPHLPGDKIITEDPYCIYPGAYKIHCERCFTILEEGMVPAPCAEHSLIEIKAEGGCIYKKCTNAPCDYIEGGDHDFLRDASRDVDPTCTEYGLEAHTCSKCGEFKDVDIEPLGHDYAQDSKVDPTCTDYGYTLHKCQRVIHTVPCTSTYKTDIVEPLGHDLKKTEAVAPLCEKDGNIAYYTCQRTYCLKIFDNEGAISEISITDTVVPQLGHEPDNNWYVTKEPTCTEKGEEQCKCVRHDDGATCSKTYEREIEINPDAHDWDAGVIDPSPTCKDHGTKTYTCNYDNSHKKTEEVAINPDNHVGETYIKDAKAEDCTNDGYTGDTYCSDCNKKLKDGEVIPAYQHDWGEWTTVTPATCEEDGLEKRVCKNDASHVEENVLPAIGHDWDEGVVETPSTCKEPGKKVFTCQNDNSHKNVKLITELDPDNHVGETYVKDEKDAVCEKDGYTGDTYCSDCNKKIEDGEVIPKTNHDWGEWTTVTPATCENEGLEKRVCKNDASHIEENKLEPIGHKWDEGVIDPSASCNEYGVKTYTCQNDNSHKKTEEVGLNSDNHLGETYVLGQKEATCEEDGYTGDTYCSDCNKKLKDGEVIPKTDHDWDEWTTVTPATCENEGLEKRVCKNDASHVEENELEPIGHKWDEGVVATPPTCKDYGEKVYTCQNDNSHQKTEELDRDPDNHAGETYVKDEKDAVCEEDGYTGDTYCTDCDTKIEDGEVIPSTDHDWGEWETTKEPTCEKDGEKERVCKNDPSHVETGSVPKIGHNPVVDPATEPTCTEPGISAGSHCADCGKTLEAGETIPELGHEMGDWYVKTPADYGVEGVEQCDCIRGDKSETRPIPALIKATYTATFVIGDEVIGTVVFEEGTKNIIAPEIPKRDNFVGYWEDYELGNEDITINGYYDPINPDDISEVVPEKKAEYVDGIAKITLSASAKSKKINVVSENTKPVDVILVLDQSGSMKEELGSKTKIDSLVECANSFVDKIYDNAVATGADHRVAIVGFAMGNYTKDSKNYPKYMNTAVLTTGGAPVGFESANESVYANALMSIVNSDGQINPSIKNVLDINKFEPKGATAADLGLQMATQIYDNNPLAEGEERQRIVLFITDGIPTLYVDTEKDEVLPVAQNSLVMAKDLKESALVYSIGISDDIDPNKAIASSSNNGWNNGKFDFNKFLHYVSSNYPYAESMNNGGEGDKDKGFYLAVNDTEKLDSIFDGILYSPVYTVEAFDKVTLVDTISSEFTLTMEQEEALRSYLAEEKGIGSDSVTITRNADGTTKIVIENVKAEKVYDETGTAYYKAEVTFEVTANEKILVPGEFQTNTDDAGVMIDGAYIGKYEIPSITISERRNIVVFTINGVVYRIDEGKLGDKITVPETDLAEWNIPEDMVIEESYTEFEATEISDKKYKITWNVGDEVTETYHTIGSVIEPIDVAEPEGMDFAGWSPAIRYTMPSRNLTYTALFKNECVHNFVCVSHSGNCVDGITVVYRCACGEEMVEKRPSADHSYTAVVVPDDTKTISNIICTNEYCSSSQGNSISYRCSYTIVTGRRTRVVDIDFLEGGIKVQPENGKVAIMVPIDSEIEKYNFSVTSIDSDNNEEILVSEKRDGYLIFYTDHFSIFKITVLDESGNPSEELSYSQCMCELNGHVMTETVVAPSCTTEGYIKHSCSNCDYFYFDNNEEATGHDYKSETVESSCTNSGYVKYKCENCGHTYMEGDTESAGHSYVAQVTAPTCTTDGYTTYTCSDCGISYVGDEVKSEGHKYNGTVVAPTCTTAGYTTFVCDACGDEYVGDNKAAKGHNIQDRVVESDCTNSGYTVHECADCDYSYVDGSTPESGHKYVKTVVPATCTSTGYTKNECSGCGHSYVSDETPLASHTPGDWTLRDGKYVKVCTACGAVVETRVSDISIDGAVNGNTSMVVYYKMSKPLNVTASEGKIVYSSADPDIAEVDENGRVKGVKTGTTTITASIEGTNDSVTCEVTVKFTWWQWIIRILLLGFLWY